MKRLFSSKKFLIAVLLVLIAAAVGGYFVFRKKGSEAPQEVVVEQEIKADDLFAYLEQQDNFLTFTAETRQVDITEKLKPNEAGVEPSFIIFAPEDKAFESDELKPFASLPLALKAEILQYHLVVLPPSPTGEAPSLELTDGAKFVTAVGRELFVKNIDGDMVLIDIKGRHVKPTGRYAVDPKGNRIYFIDSVLLLQ